MRMARIAPAELGELIAAGADPVILDVRSPSALRLDPRAIPGARPVDPEAPDAQLSGVPPEREVVVYCS
jgi:rhodanese-related sulfurtransferase